MSAKTSHTTRSKQHGRSERLRKRTERAQDADRQVREHLTGRDQ